MLIKDINYGVFRKKHLDFEKENNFEVNEQQRMMLYLEELKRIRKKANEEINNIKKCIGEDNDKKRDT